MELKKNRVKRILQTGGTCFGTMIRMVRIPQMIPLCAAAGWNYVILDTEHNEATSDALAALALAAKSEDLCFLVRVPDKEYSQIAKPLDLGAEGLVVPRVDVVEEAERIIRSAKYHPLGERGASISTVATRFRSVDPASYLEWANAETLIVIQIESVEAVENLDEILAVGQIDAIMIGPFDLSQSMGIPGDFEDRRLAKSYEKVIEIAEKHNVAPGIHLNSMEQVERWVKAGMRFVTYQYDSQFLLDGYQRAIAELGEIGLQPRE